MSTNERVIRILIADDHPVVRAGLRAVFTSAEGFEVAAEAATAREAVTRVAAGGFDLVTMDLQFHERMGGVDAIRELAALPSAPPVLVLTNYDDDSDILAAIEAGAKGYLLKDSPPQDLVDAARRAARGEVVLASPVATRLVTRMRAPKIELTARERDMLNALDRGLTNKEISEELFLSPTTIKTHLARLYAKLEVSSRTAALARARELGLL